MARPSVSLVPLVSLLVAVLGTGVTPAHAQGVAGRWKATFDSDIRIERDTFIVNRRSAATLVLTAKGDSLYGTWNDDGPAPEMQFRGTYDGRTLRLATDAREQTVRRDGEPVTMVVRTEWTGRLDGNQLRGTMLIHLGDRPVFPRRWEATRE